MTGQTTSPDPYDLTVKGAEADLASLRIEQIPEAWSLGRHVSPSEVSAEVGGVFGVTVMGRGGYRRAETGQVALRITRAAPLGSPSVQVEIELAMDRAWHRLALLTDLGEIWAEVIRRQVVSAMRIAEHLREGEACIRLHCLELARRRGL